MNWNSFDTRWNIFDVLVARCSWLQTKSKHVQGNSMTLAAEKTWRLLLAKAGRPATDSECAKLLSLFELFLQIAEIQKRSTCSVHWCLERICSPMRSSTAECPAIALKQPCYFSILFIGSHFTDLRPECKGWHVMETKANGRSQIPPELRPGRVTYIP